MDDQIAPAERFRALHRPGTPLLQPNAWDVGSARILEAMGFEAIATTSSGFAATLGRNDYRVARDEAIGHGADLAAAVAIPVSADTENGFADDPDGVAETVRLAAAAGLAGCSIEDHTGDAATPIYELAEATARIAAATEAARSAGVVLTARAENHLHGRDDLADTIRRLQAFQEAGADVLFAPGVLHLDDIRTLVAEVDRPVNVLALPGCPPVAALAEVGVARVSVGGAFAYAALGGLIAAATELRDSGTFGYWTQVGAARPTIRDAFESG